MSVRLSRIDIFPVKSFDAVSVNEARMLPSGALENDRGFAMFDSSGRVVNGKRTPLVHMLKFEYDSHIDQVKITDRNSKVEDRFSLRQDRKAIETRLSQHFGFAVELRENAERGFPDDTLASGPTVIAAETLSMVAEWFNLSFDEARRRFRANLILEGGGPFWDDRLFAAPGETVTFRIGDAMLFGTNPCARCVVPSRDTQSGEQWRGFAKSFSEKRQASIPQWASVDALDHFYRLAVNTRLFSPNEGALLQVGDCVEILG